MTPTKRATTPTIKNILVGFSELSTFLTILEHWNTKIILHEIKTNI